MKRLTAYSLLLLMLLGLTACNWRNNDDPLYDQIVGHWVADYEYDGYRTYDCWGASEYYFHSNGTGEYIYFDEWGREVYVRFTWDVSRSTIRVTYLDTQYADTYYFYYEWDRDGDLLLSTDPNLREYIAYRYVR